MLWNLPVLWLTMAVAAVVILSFIVATALDALIRDEAFGAIGNTVVMAFGFFCGDLSCQQHGPPAVRFGARIACRRWRRLCHARFSDCAQRHDATPVWLKQKSHPDDAQNISWRQPCRTQAGKADIVLAFRQFSSILIHDQIMVVIDRLRQAKQLLQ